MFILDSFTLIWHFPLDLHLFSTLLMFSVHNLIPTNIRSKSKREKETLLNKVIYIVNQELKPRRNANHRVPREGTAVQSLASIHTPETNKSVDFLPLNFFLCMWSDSVSVFKFIEIIFWVNQGQNSNLGFNCWSSKQDVQIFLRSNKPSVNGVAPTHDALLDQQEMYLHLLAPGSRSHFKHYTKTITSGFLAPSKEGNFQWITGSVSSQPPNSFTQLSHNPGGSFILNRQ